MTFEIVLGLLFLLALALGLVATPLVQRLAVKVNALDLPGERKLHRQPIPRLGGIAIYLAFVITLNSGLLFSDSLLKLVDASLRGWLGLLFGGSIVLALGIVDDLYQLRPVSKLSFQLLAAGVVCLSGLRITQLTNPFNGVLVLGWLSIPMTLLWIVGITNAMNLLDGLDGLASGVAAIITATILSISLANGTDGTALVSAILCGSTLGFLRYNFNPARIFMGDSGSMFLGFTLAVISLQGTQKSTTAVAIFIPILFFGLPIADTLLALGRRLLGSGGREQARGYARVFEADREHIHHKLIDLGFSHRSAVLTLYVVTLGLSCVAFAMTAVRSETVAFLLSAVLLTAVACLLLLAGAAARHRRPRAESSERS
jgi:UDP-GlcNAc:undecaprenyl-phosphate GlcNAc-1-phosphate transferase